MSRQGSPSIFVTLAASSFVGVSAENAEERVAEEGVDHLIFVSEGVYSLEGTWRQLGLSIDSRLNLSLWRRIRR
jgi:hypothetical protein